MKTIYVKNRRGLQEEVDAEEIKSPSQGNYQSLMSDCQLSLTPTKESRTSIETKKKQE